MKKVFAFLFVASIIVAACKKYKEDPFISLRCPEKRLEGKWFLTNYTLNGKGMMHIYGAHGLLPVFQFYDRRPDTYTGYTIDCYNCFAKPQGPLPIDNWHQPNLVLAQDLKFSKNYKELALYAGNPYLNPDSMLTNDTSAFLNFNIDWEIKKLTNKDMCLYAKYNDDINILTFEKQ